MRVGTLCYATDQGLGILAKSFYDNGIVTDAIVVRHGKHPTHDEWYPNSFVTGDMIRDREAILQFLSKLDVFLAFETPFHWDLFSFCKECGVKTVLMPMHECLHSRVEVHPPDLWLCSSLLDLDVANEYVKRIGGKAVHIPVPVQVPWRQRTKAEVFVHNAGHGGLKGRNGTKELLEAAFLVKSPARLLVRSQDNIIDPDPRKPRQLADNVELRMETVPYDQLWNEGDVFVFPEKFNGLSLPLQEARAAGMLVMATFRYPNGEWLPTEVVANKPGDPLSTFPIKRCPLIPCCGFKRSKIGPPYQEFDESVIDPRAIAAKIDEWYGRDITEYSLQGKAWAESMNWEALKPKYLNELEELCQKRL